MKKKPTTDKKRNRRFLKSNEADVAIIKEKYCDVLDSNFPELELEHKILSNGIATKLKDIKNISRVVFTFNFVSISADDNSISGELALNGLRLERDSSEEAIAKLIPEDYEDNLKVIQNNLPILRGINQEAVLEILSGELVSRMTAKYQKISDRMNKNRAKLEAKEKEANEAKKAALKKKATTKKPVVKKTPVKRAAKKPTAKK